MKSVLIARNLVTVMPATGLPGLALGDLIAIDYAGQVVDQARAAVLATDNQPYRFFLGLGNGKYVGGQWLGARETTVRREDYVAPTAVTVTIDFTSVTDQSLIAFTHIGFDVTTPKKYTYDYEKNWSVSVPVIFGDTVPDIVARMQPQVLKLQENINRYYGVGQYTVTLSGTTFVVTAVAGRDVNATASGAFNVPGVTNVKTGTPAGVGTPAQVREYLEKYGIPTWGDNPNYRRGQDPFNTSVAYQYDPAVEGYDMLTIEAQVDSNHPFYPTDTGMRVTQFIAADEAGTVLDDIVAMFGYTSHIVNVTTR